MITFDIETLPCTDFQTLDIMSDTIKPPGNIKKQESKEKWLEENYDAALEKAISDTSFSAMYGSIACIAWAGEDKRIHSSSSVMSESQAIASFYAHILKQPDDKYCGHNIASFDLKFLKQRSIILGIKPPQSIWHAMNAKPWDSCIADTMLMWDANISKMISMNNLCKTLGIKGKGDFDGSMVAKTWPKNPQKVIDYCIDDVKKNMEIYDRLTFNKQLA